MILQNYLQFWWRKESTYDETDDIRFVTSIIGTKNGNIWTVNRLEYPLIKRSGVAINIKGNWHFLGLLSMGKSKMTQQSIERDYE